MGVRERGEVYQSMQPLPVQIAGFEFQLLPPGGVYWPARQMLLVADLHLGKEATFRSHGMAVPRGTSDGTLASVSAMLAVTQCERVVFVGDLFHARSSLQSDVQASVSRFLESHRDVRFQLIVGNHDQHLGRLPEDWSIEVLGDDYVIDRLQLNHYPGSASESADLRISGHLHPAIKPDRRTGLPGRLPCFYLSKQCLVLPAIGRFTGTSLVKPTPGEKTWWVVEDQVVPFAS